MTEKLFDTKCDAAARERDELRNELSQMDGVHVPLDIGAKSTLGGGQNMGKTKIEWATDVWNPIVGCSIVSPGCSHCYAQAQAARIQRMTPNSHYLGTTRTVNGHEVWTGEIKSAPEHIWTAPQRWKRPRRIFVNSMSDLFHESVPDEWIDRVFAVMIRARHHTFQILTKRSARMRSYMNGLICNGGFRPYIHRPGWKSPDPRDGDKVFLLDKDQAWPLSNVWLGVSAEDQRRADERRADLAALAANGWTTFVSYEPALGPVDWSGWEFLKWFIGGGESGRNARPSHPDWHRASRDFCAPRGVAYFFKQWGEWAPGDAFGSVEDGPVTTSSGDVKDWMKRYVVCVDRADRLDGHSFTDHATDLVYRVGKKRAGRALDGVIHDAFPGVP